MATSQGFLLTILVVFLVLNIAKGRGIEFDGPSQEEPPWYDIDGSPALYEIAQKPVAIHLDLTPYRVHTQKNKHNLENNFEKRYLSPYRMKKSELSMEDDPKYWKLLGRMG
eukprot:TRINITY_DN25119_c0_g1_i1.p1 TRINITY_DN25119_c0_g1~~TRINITY_DN25119_c0_g1_i1.p1  ORF type:complete len:111 (-),score=23.75 TRINITY_DN25119_c0_g1_i1:179-511(-)